MDYYNFEPGNCKGLVYYGKSDILAQITQEVSCNPDSCFSRNLLAWYNSSYDELSDFDDCRYQVEVNVALCEQDPPSTLEEIIDILVGFVSGNNRRIANAAIRIICREALRRVTIEKAPNA